MNNSFLFPRRDIEKDEQSVDFNVFAQDSSLRRAHRDLTATLDDLQGKSLAQRNLAIKENNKRYEVLSEMLVSIDVVLSKLFGSLMPFGSCRLNYPSDPILLFEVGVSLMAKCEDQASWREVIQIAKTLFAF